MTKVVLGREIKLDRMGNSNTNRKGDSAPQAQDEKSDNCLPVVQKVKKSELALPSKSNNVIGLDFGTSTLVVSYVTSASPVPKEVKILEEDIDYSTPTVLLIDENNKVEVGNEALLRYTDFDVNNFKRITFFEKVKLELQHNKVYTFTKSQVRIQYIYIYIYIYTCCSCNIIINV